MTAAQPALGVAGDRPHVHVVREPIVRRVDSREEWNGLAEQFADYDVHQGFEWGELRGTIGWRPVRLAVADGDRCLAACSLLSRRVPLAGAVFFAPRGPLFDASVPGGLGALVDAIRGEARRARAIFLRASPPISADDEAAVAALRAHGFLPLPDMARSWRTTQVLDLRPSEVELWRQLYRADQVTTAARRGVRVDECHDERGLEQLHRLLVGVGGRRGFPVRSAEYVAEIVRQYGSKQLTLLASVDGDVVGGVLAIRGGDRMVMLYSASNEAARKNHAGLALYWELVRRSRALGCRWLDWGPSEVGVPPSETDPGWGVFRFKARFGSVQRTYPAPHDLVFRRATYRAVRAFETALIPRLVRAAAHPLVGRLLRRARGA
jgi:lipid II:glycine glycyltransferase (peptidoglycan interpeptide bridge formation enzyme)